MEVNIDPKLIVGLLTLGGTLVIAYNTNKLNKATKYIETITTERIEWIKEFRKEMSTILKDIDSLIVLYKKNLIVINEIDKERARYIRLLNTETLDHMKRKEKIKNEIDKTIELISIESELRRKIFNIRLMLNLKDDKELNELLIKFLEKLNKNIYDEKDCFRLKENLITQTKKILKQEWERVKEETDGRKRRKQKWFW